MESKLIDKTLFFGFCLLTLMEYSFFHFHRTNFTIYKQYRKHKPHEKSDFINLPKY